MRGQVRYYLSTDLDLRGAAEFVLSSSLKERVAEGWRVFPELWNRLTGRVKGPTTPLEATFVLPVTGTITSVFGYRTDPVTGETAFHTGIDIAAAEGTPIVAALGGTVLSVEENESYGKVVEVDHGQAVITLYAHTKDVVVKTGDMVKQGDTIATVGQTGKTTSSNCHFEVIIDGQPVDPLGMKGLASAPP
jgi:murein DD-endopeptidase MepM/ murein hydrolase activator NlpD